MKVLIINSDYGSGSTGRIVRDIKTELERQQNTCIALYGRENCCTDSNVFQIGNFFSVYAHVFMTRLADMQGFASVYATKQCLNRIDAFKPDIIHLHNLHGSYIDCRLLFDYVKQHGIPTLWTLHDCWPFTGHCSNYSFVSCDKWKVGCRQCAQRREYPKSLVDRSEYNYKNKKMCFTGCSTLQVTTVSQWLQREVKESFLAEYKTVVIANGVDLELFRPIDSEMVKQKYGLRGRKTIISVASVWGPRKGLALLLSVASRLDDRYRLVIVGLKEKTKNIPSNVIVLPRTDNIGELVELYSAADVYLNASVEETFGMVSLEALACGTPVITNRLTANPELVDDSCGVVVPHYTVEDYLNAIRNNKIWEIAPDDCRKRAERYSRKKMVEGYVNHYRSML